MRNSFFSSLYGVVLVDDDDDDGDVEGDGCLT